jgi:CubicO group peptidase (beta-lactamase class C family)
MYHCWYVEKRYRFHDTQLTYNLDLNHDLHQVNPVFAPQKETSYSNVGFNILGEILSNVTGLKYEDYISTSILNPLGMKDSTFEVPDNSVAANAGSGSYWDFDLAVGIP